MLGKRSGPEERPELPTLRSRAWRGHRCFQSCSGALSPAEAWQLQEGVARRCLHHRFCCKTAPVQHALLPRGRVQAAAGTAVAAHRPVPVAGGQEQDKQHGADGVTPELPCRAATRARGRARHRRPSRAPQQCASTRGSAGKSTAARVAIFEPQLAHALLRTWQPAQPHVRDQTASDPACLPREPALAAPALRPGLPGWRGAKAEVPRRCAAPRVLLTAREN